MTLVIDHSGRALTPRQVTIKDVLVDSQTHPVLLAQQLGQTEISR